MLRPGTQRRHVLGPESLAVTRSEFYGLPPLTATADQALLPMSSSGTASAALAAGQGLTLLPMSSSGAAAAGQAAAQGLTLLPMSSSGAATSVPPMIVVNGPSGGGITVSTRIPRTHTPTEPKSKRAPILPRPESTPSFASAAQTMLPMRCTAAAVTTIQAGAAVKLDGMISTAEFRIDHTPVSLAVAAFRADMMAQLNATVWIELGEDEELEIDA